MSPGPCGIRDTLRAFSLVELVIALSILGIGLIGAMRVFPVGLKASQRAELRSRAVFNAQHELESLKVSPWENLKEGETRRSDPPFTLVTTISAAHPEYVTSLSDLKQIEVTVEWPQDGKTQSLGFSTFIRRKSS